MYCKMEYRMNAAYNGEYYTKPLAKEQLKVNMYERVETMYYERLPLHMKCHLTSTPAEYQVQFLYQSP